MQDLKTLETEGVFVPLLGSFLKGTVHSIVADNLGAHSFSGFLQTFSGDFLCPFCTAKRCDIESDAAASGAFGLRTKELHSEHVRTALETILIVEELHKSVFSSNTSHIFTF